MCKLLNCILSNPEKNNCFLSTNDRSTPRSFKNILVTRDIDSQIDELQKPGIDLYFACSSFNSPDNRTGDNAVGARAFYMDIDCGPAKSQSNKGYTTTDEALEALNSFCKQASLPKPNAIVNSGNGLHVYWILDGFVKKSSWQAAARKLKALTKKLGLLADPSRTADIASVLRVPGTLNHKYTPPKPVELIFFDEKLIEVEV